MNNIRLLTTIGFLIVGTLGLGAPTAFAVSLYDSYARDNVGKTTYNTDSRRYEISNIKSDRLTVGVLFHNQDKQPTFRSFHTCNTGPGTNCQGDLPKGVTGTLCMATGLGSGTDPNNYEYGQPVCFSTGS
jgi:hypothetical protein